MISAKHANSNQAKSFRSDQDGDFSPEHLANFREKILTKGRTLWRNLPWRQDFDPYKIWISEVMLQQTQVSRVDGRWQSWLERFPTVDALAAASTADVLEEWQGLGYNRRALSALACAQEISSCGGVFPRATEELVKLPGIGPATAAGIRAFAFNLHAVYLETNVRSVFLHELFPDEKQVPDTQLIPLVEATCPPDATDPFAPVGDNDDPRSWYLSLLDYGADLKKRVTNPSRRSATHTRQSKFEGSRRQKRAELVRLLLAPEAQAYGCDLHELVQGITSFEQAHGRDAVDAELVEELLAELVAEGFCTHKRGRWQV